MFMKVWTQTRKDDLSSLIQNILVEFTMDRMQQTDSGQKYWII